MAIRTLKIFTHRYLRQILRTNWARQITNSEARRPCCDTGQLSIFFQHRRLQRFDNVLRFFEVERFWQTLPRTMFDMILSACQRAENVHLFHWRGCEASWPKINLPSPGVKTKLDDNLYGFSLSLQCLFRDNSPYPWIRHPLTGDSRVKPQVSKSLSQQSILDKRLLRWSW